MPTVSRSVSPRRSVIATSARVWANHAFTDALSRALLADEFEVALLERGASAQRDHRQPDARQVVRHDGDAFGRRHDGTAKLERARPRSRRSRARRPATRDRPVPRSGRSSRARRELVERALDDDVTLVHDHHASLGVRSASVSSWVVTKIAQPRSRSAASRSRMTWRPSGSTAVVGSSSTQRLRAPEQREREQRALLLAAAEAAPGRRRTSLEVEQRDQFVDVARRVVVRGGEAQHVARAHRGPDAAALQQARRCARRPRDGRERGSSPWRRTRARRRCAKAEQRLDERGLARAVGAEQGRRPRRRRRGGRRRSSARNAPKSTSDLLDLDRVTHAYRN